MNLFSEDNIFGQIFSFLGDLILLNLLWLVCSLPVVTAGAATTALYYAVMKMHRDGDGSVCRNFFKSFRQNFFQSTASWLALAAAGLAIWAEARWMRAEGVSSMIFSYAAAAAGMLWAVLALYLFPVIAAFENGLRRLAGHAFYFAFQKIGYLAAVAAVTCLPMYFTMVDAKLFPIYLFIWLMTGFSLTAYGNAWFFLRLFSPYLPKIGGTAPRQAAKPEQN